jgi:hypothetical protein
VQLTRTHRILICVVVTGVVVVAGIGFAGSYAAVRDLALRKGFGGFAYVFPVGVDAGIVVLLSLDLLLAWLRIPFPLLRQTAWLLTAATIAFNGAAAWPDLLGVGMHAIIPVLFVVSVEAARHAVGRIADITAERHMEGVRLARWFLAPWSTFRLWRRMKVWELRSYEEVIGLEQGRLVYRARLRARYGRGWRREAPVEALMPLRLARFGVSLAETGPAGLAAAGIEVASDPAPVLEEDFRAPTAALATARPGPGRQSVAVAAGDGAYAGAVRAQVRGHGESQRLGQVGIPAPSAAHRVSAGRRATAGLPSGPERQSASVEVSDVAGSPAVATPAAAGRRPAGEQLTTVDRYYRAWAQYVRSFGSEPSGDQLSRFLAERGFTGRGGGAVSPSTLRRYLPEFRVYAAWQHILEDQGREPTADELALVLAGRGVSGAAYTAAKLKPFLDDFPRRRTALAGDWADGSA